MVVIFLNTLIVAKLVSIAEQGLLWQSWQLLLFLEQFLLWQ